MPKVNEIVEADAEKLYPLAIPFGNNGTSVTLNIKYRPPTTERTMQPTVADQLASVIVEWDLVDDDGPIQPTAAYLSKRPLSFLDKIMGAINADFFPAKGK